MISKAKGPAEIISVTSKSATSISVTRKILIIEDEGEMCLLINLLLDDKSMSIDHVNSLANARALLEQWQPDIILLDNRLPDGFGIDFISYLKNNYPAIKIIMISGIDAAAGDLALEVGADAFLPKPFNKKELIQVIGPLVSP